MHDPKKSIMTYQELNFIIDVKEESKNRYFFTLNIYSLFDKSISLYYIIQGPQKCLLSRL